MNWPMKSSFKGRNPVIDPGKEGAMTAASLDLQEAMFATLTGNAALVA